MVTEEQIIHIAQLLPDLAINKALRNENGQNNDVIIVNDEYVFRFPKYLKGIIDLEREVVLLKTIKQRATLTIPSPIFYSFKEKKPGKAFAGYKMIKGQPMWKQDFSLSNQESKERIASQLVNFLYALHSIPTDELPREYKKNVERPLKAVEMLYEKLKEKIFPLISPQSRESVSQRFDLYIEHQKTQTTDIALIHGDFGASNILWDPIRGEITGVIDFGGSQQGDPAYDFAGLLSSYGEDFFNMCTELYPGGHQIKDRVYFYRSTFALQEALHGIENSDQAALRNGIQDYI